MGLVSSCPEIFDVRVLTINKAINTGHRNILTRIISHIDEADAAERYEVECEDNKAPRPATSRAESVNSSLPRKIIAWEDEDPENPYNWSNVSANDLIVDSITNSVCHI